MKRLHAGLWLVVAMCFAAAFGAGFAIYLRPVEGSRNSAGTYSPTAGIPVVTHSTISSTVFNNLIADIGNEITSSVDKAGRTTMTAQLPLYNGTSTSPSFGFASETTAGLYRVSSGIVAMTFNGTESSRWTTNGIRVASGVVATPGLSFTSETGTGWYRAGAGDIRFAVSGADKHFLSATGLGIGVAPTVALDIQSGNQRIEIGAGANTSGYTFDIGANDDGVNFHSNSASRGFNFKQSAVLVSIASGGLTIGASGTAISQSVAGTASFSTGSMAGQTCITTTVTTTGSASGAPCAAGNSADPGDARFAITCRTHTAGQCQVDVCNTATTGIDPADMTLSCRVFNP